MAPMDSGVPSPIFDLLTGPFGVLPASTGLLISAFTATAIFITRSPDCSPTVTAERRPTRGPDAVQIRETTIVLTTNFTVH